MKTRIVRLSLAAASGVAAGMSTWHELARAPARTRWKHIFPVLTAPLLAAVGAANEEPGRLLPRPPLTLRRRVALLYMPLGLITMIPVVLGWVFESPRERELRYQEYQDQRQRYQRFAQLWKKRQGWRRIGLWSQLRSRRATALAERSRATFLALALVRGVCSGMFAWRNLSGDSKRQRLDVFVAAAAIPLTYLQLAGVLPSRLWIPQPFRRCLGVAVRPWLLFGALSLTVWAAMTLRLAFLPAEEYPRQYDAWEQIRQQSEDRRREREQQRTGWRSRRKWWLLSTALL